MNLHLQAVFYNVMSTAIGVLLVGVVFSQTSLFDNAIIYKSIFVFAPYAISGLFLHGLMTERWLRPALRLYRSLEANVFDRENSLADMRSALRFPIRSMFLSILTWIAVILAGLLQLKALGGVDQEFVVVAATIATSIGMWCWLLQLFLNRRMLTKVVEAFIDRHPDLWTKESANARLALFPLRAKWLMLSVFLVGLTSFLGIVYTAGALRGQSKAQYEELVQDQLDALIPILDIEILTDASIPPAGIIVSQKKFSRSVTVSKLSRWFEFPFWIHDEFGQLLFASDQSYDFADAAVRKNVIRRNFGEGFRLSILPEKSNAVNRFVPLLAVFVLVVMSSAFSVFLVAIFVGRDVARSLSELKKAAGAYNEGNFSESILVNSDDDLAFLSITLSKMRETLQKFLKSLQQASYIFEESSEDVVGASSRITQFNNEQDRNIGQIQASMQELREHFGSTQENLEILRKRVSKGQRETETSAPLLSSMDRTASSLIEESTQLSTATESIGDLLSSYSGTLSNWKDSNNRQILRVQQLERHVESMRETVGRITFDQKTKVNEGGDVMRDFTAKLQSFNSATTKLEGLLGQVSKSMTGLEDAMTWVNEIGDDTRLLSLNASILSAQAQKEGRSFSVIAKSIEGLADHSDDGVQLLQDSMQHLSIYENSMQQSVGELAASTQEALMVAQTVSNIQLSHKSTTADFEQKLGKLDTALSELGERFKLASHRLIRISEILRDLESLLSNEKYRYAELEAQIATMISRITEIKGHSQYQAGRTSTVRDHLDAVAAQIEKVASLVLSYVESSDDLISFSKHISKVVHKQKNLVSHLSEDVAEFDSQTRRFASELEQYTLVKQ
jgi:methyl-accepting chemotaxis protein